MKKKILHLCMLNWRRRMIPLACSHSSHGVLIGENASMQDSNRSELDNKDSIEPATPNYRLSGAPSGPWGQRFRSDEAGSDFAFMPPSKSQRTTGNYKSRWNRTSSVQSRKVSTLDVAFLQSPFTHSPTEESHGSGRLGTFLLEPMVSYEGPVMSTNKVPQNSPTGSCKRRRIPESSGALLDGAYKSSADEFPLDMKLSQSEFTFLMGWPFLDNKIGCKNWVFLLVLLLFLCCMLQRYQLRLLEQENALLKAASGQSLEQIDAYSDAKDHKVARSVMGICGLLFLLGSLYVLKGHFCSSYLWKKLISCKNIDEVVPFSKRVAYLVDVLFSTHPYAKSIALLFATFLLIGFGACLLYAVGDEDFMDALWKSWTYVADSGNHADSIGMGPRIVSVGISIGGMLIFALMLGLVSDAISEKVDSLKKGKSEVIESGHTLILGWSDKLGSLLKQLAIANESLGGGVVVVLAERDKEEMELDIGKLEFDLLGTSVICRSGSPLIMADLKKVSVSKARSIIVLAEVENADQSDARALRVVLSLTAVKEDFHGHIVVELSDLDNEPLVKLVGGDIVETVVSHDVIGRLMIQCARQPGLAQIWEDILGFDKAEFYIKRWSHLDGMSFNDVLVSFPDAIPCGIKTADDKGKIILNPDGHYVLCKGDEVLVIAEDDDSYAPTSPSKVHCGSLPQVPIPPKLPEKILFCGWRRDIHDMIKVLDAFLPRGSELWIFCDVSIEERERKLHEENLYQMENIKIQHRQGNPVIRRHLEMLPLQTFDSILILADEKLEENIVIADSRSLASLLLIRDIQSKRIPDSYSDIAQRRRTGCIHGSWIGDMQQVSDQSIIISEILDSRTKHLVSLSKISDYVLSNELVSMALATVAEEKQINRVLKELFGEEGNELYIRSAEYYLYDQEELTFFQIMLRAHQRHEIVIGYRKAYEERAIVNPPNKAVPYKWSTADVFVILGNYNDSLLEKIHAQ